MWKRYCQILLFRQGSQGQKYHLPQFRNLQQDSFHNAFQGLLYACSYLNSKWFSHADILKLVYLIFDVLFILYKHSPYEHQVLQSLYWRAVVHTSHHPKDFQLARVLLQVCSFLWPKIYFSAISWSISFRYYPTNFCSGAGSSMLFWSDQYSE